jgi:hypothetical protein
VNVADGLYRVHPIVRAYFVQAIPNTGPIHEKLGTHFTQLLSSTDVLLPRDAAEVVLDVVYHLSQSRNLRREDIQQLASKLHSEGTPTARAYSSLLDAALRMPPQPAASHPEASTSSPRVFLSYVREDILEVNRLKADLRKNGIDAWQDSDRLVPGRRWKQEIRQAIKSGDFFVACFSHHYTARTRTYMNEELLVAVEEMRLRAEHRSWFIPALFSPLSIPEIAIGPGETLADLHWVDLHGDWNAGVSSLLRALKQ